MAKQVEGVELSPEHVEGIATLLDDADYPGGEMLRALRARLTLVEQQRDEAEKARIEAMLAGSAPYLLAYDLACTDRDTFRTQRDEAVALLREWNNYLLAHGITFAADYLAQFDARTQE